MQDDFLTISDDKFSREEDGINDDDDAADDDDDDAAAWAANFNSEPPRCTTSTSKFVRATDVTKISVRSHRCRNFGYVLAFMSHTDFSIASVSADFFCS